MADREWVITFDGEEARVALVPRDREQGLAHLNLPVPHVIKRGDQFRVCAPSAQRAEQIARAIRKPEKEKA